MFSIDSDSFFALIQEYIDETGDPLGYDLLSPFITTPWMIYSAPPSRAAVWVLERVLGHQVTYKKDVALATCPECGRFLQARSFYEGLCQECRLNMLNEKGVLD